MTRTSALAALTLLGTALTSVRAQPPPPPPSMPSPAPGAMPPTPLGSYPGVTSSHCRYLINAPSPWGTNASPFKLYTRSYSGEVKRGYPIEVSILPYSETFRLFNFTDFAVWAESATPPSFYGSAAGAAGASVPPPLAPATHLGVWQVFPQYSGGSGTMKCNMYSRGEDTVGSFEERMVELLKTQFPFDGRLLGFNPSARTGVAFLWYPDERTMGQTSIKFVAKLKTFGQWFSLESSAWRVQRPPMPPRPLAPVDPVASLTTFVDQYTHMAGQARTMERQLDAANAPGF